MRTVQVWNTTTGGMLAASVKIAETTWSRMRGLLGRNSLGNGEGLWIWPSSGVHTIGMSFAIDVIGLDRNKQVIKLWSHLVPGRITSVSWKLRSVIELPAGIIAESGIKIGDALHMDQAPHD
ncbi:DUF192 domain-containing protein [Acidicapsa ligni]|uniref:DUF192 domain-containing protein n=1 Tax=Acidicapsa ligni TaxID=542300 RepID=UPI0021E09892|nr:DUF192 domain-containing protein [Acidicapsa ligni]